MCSVFRPTQRADWVHSKFGVDLPEYAATDVYPGYLAPIVVKSHRYKRVASGLARFGLIPAWSKDDKISRYTYNARSETVADKPSYRKAWRNRQFAVVLADGFDEPCYESGRAVRWRIRQDSKEPFGIAGLWDKWINPASGELIASFTMLTIHANDHPVMRRFHRPEDEKRTPMVLPANKYQDWLDATHDTARALLRLDLMPGLTAEPLQDGDTRGSVCHTDV